ncbi:MAG: hypothetical protein Q7T56_13920 [Nocardioidaceae bacterium]|nr:hypothetical protein [Nocardioidaceae bacterium]
MDKRLIALAAVLLGLVTSLLASPAPSVAAGGGGSAAAGNCTVYATGTGMGSYCANGAGGDVATLTERFGNQVSTFQNCKYQSMDDDAPGRPAGLKRPANTNPERGEWWLATCLRGIDFDSAFGGTDRRVEVFFVFLDHGFDTDYDDTPLSDFLWDIAAETVRFPAPFADMEPTATPRVGVPTFFTFRWLDPITQDPLGDGEFEGAPRGGPFIRTVNRGLEMEARATQTVVDPRQRDIEAATCGPGNPEYDPEIPVERSDEQDSTCFITFPRSSATAAERSTVEIPSYVGDSYFAQVRVTWTVRYRQGGGAWTQLGSFPMLANQPILVREVQANNIPPRFEIS